VKVADFGLARLTDPSAEQLGHTMTGTVMGTPDYMAPEQAEGMNVDHRADIYSVGVMIYEMMCRQVPKGIFDPPSHRTGCDTRIDEIVIKAMHQSPERRFQSTQEMRTAITEARAPLPARAGRAVPQPRAVARSGAPPRPPQKPPTPVAPRPAPIPPQTSVMQAIAPPAPAKKSKLALYGGIGAGVAALAVAAFLLMPKKEKLTKAQIYAMEHAGAPNANATPTASRSVVSSTAPRLIPSTERWQDRMDELATLLGNPPRENGALRVADEKVFTLKGLVADGAMRILFSPGPKNSSHETRFKIRFNDDGYCGFWTWGPPTNHRSIQVTIDQKGKPHQASFGGLIQHPDANTFAPGKPTELELRTVGPKLTMKLDGKLLGERDIPLLSPGFFQCTFGGGTVVHAIETLDLSKPAPVAAKSMPLPVITGWQDAMPRAKEKLRSVGKVELEEKDGWLISKSPSANNISYITDQPLTDCAVRGRTRGSMNIGWRALPGANNAGWYVMKLEADGSGLIENRGGHVPLATFKVPPAPEHDFLITIVGEVFNVWVDGAFAATARDSAHPTGNVSIFPAEIGAAVRDLAVAELPPDFVSTVARSTTVSPESLPNQTIDLLALADPAKDKMKAEGMAGANLWNKTGGQLSFKSSDGKSGKISAPVSLNGARDYEVEVDLQQSPNALVTLDFPISAASQATLDFSIGNNVTLAADEKRQRYAISAWPAGVKAPYRLAGRLKLDPDGETGTLTASVNGQAVGSWHGPVKKLGKTVEMHPDFPGQLLPALFVFNGDRAYSSWTLRVFDGEAKLLRGASSQSAQNSSAVETWHDSLPSWWAMVEKNPSLVPQFAKEAGGMRLVANMPTVVARAPQGETVPDLAIRATVRDSKIWNLIMGGYAKKSHYIAEINPGYGVIRLDDQTGAHILQRFKLPPGFALSERHTSEFRGQGNTLTFLLDGKEMATVSDAQRGVGSGQFVGSAGTLLEKLEYADLGSPATPPGK
jgi:hypothetical protein